MRSLRRVGSPAGRATPERARARTAGALVVVALIAAGCAGPSPADRMKDVDGLLAAYDAAGSQMVAKAREYRDGLVATKPVEQILPLLDQAETILLRRDRVRHKADAELAAIEMAELDAGTRLRVKAMRAYLDRSRGFDEAYGDLFVVMREHGEYLASGGRDPARLEQLEGELMKMGERATSASEKAAQAYEAIP